MHGDFYKELDIDWDPRKLTNIMLGYPSHMWKVEAGVSNRYLRINDPYIDSIMTQLQDMGYNARNKFFSEIKGKTNLPMHTDFSRSTAVNFPIVGNWEMSPINFHDKLNRSVMESYTYRPGQAVWINTQMLHSVRNLSPSPRFILSVSLYEQEVE